MIALCFAATAAPMLALQADRAISQYAHRAWRIEEGLPNSVARSIVQTDDGYLWIATYDGLARYNGDTFTRFDKNNLPGLKRDTVLAFLKSRDGALWIGTNGGGVARFAGGKLQVFTVQQGVPNDVVGALAESHDGTIWIGTSSGICTYRNGKIEHIMTPANGMLSNGSILSIVESRDGTIWIGTRGGGLFAMRDYKVQRFYTIADGLTSDAIFAIYPDADGSLWIGTSRGLNRMKNGAISAIAGIPSDQLTAILRDSDGLLWVGSYSQGLFRSVDGVSFSNYSSKEGLLNNSVRALFEDSEKNFWVGTNGGLERFTQGRFITVGTPERLSDPYARSVFQDRAGNIWIGTAHGLNKFSGDQVTVFTTKDGLSNDYIFAIAEAPDGAMWIGTPTGLNRMVGGKVEKFNETNGLASASVRALIFDRDGTLWIGSDRGLNWYRDGKIQPVPIEGWEYAFVQAFAEGPDGSIWIGADGRGIARYHDGKFTRWSDREGLPDNHVLSMLVTHQGGVWIGTDSAGVIRMKDGKFTRFTTESGLFGDKVLQLLDDGTRIWFGGGRGVWSIERNELLEFAEGKRKRVTSIVYGYGDGMRSVQCNGSVYPAGFRTRDGRLWFPTVDGVATIAPDAPMRANLLPPPVKIESIVIDGRVTMMPLKIIVPPGAKQVEIHYAALTYSSPERVEFQYQLEGYDVNWVRAGNRRVAYYTGVPPGEYRFHVIAANADGVWNRRGATLDVELQPRFVQTIWFPLLVIASIISIVWLLQQRRVYVMRQRQKELVAIVAERTRDIQSALHEAETARKTAEEQEGMLAKALVEAEAANRAKSLFLANVSHELRTPLNAIIGFAGVLQMSGEKSFSERQLKFIHNIATSGEHLLALINDILDLAKIEAGQMTMEVEPVQLIETFDAVARVMRGLTLPRNIDIEIDVEPNIGTLVADPVKLKQIIYNLVSNAVKFSPDSSTIRIVAKRLAANASPLEQDSVAISVIDHGIGIAAEHQQVIFEEFRQVQHPTMKRPSGTGLGLTLVKKFVEMHDGRITIESAPGKGSTFTAIFPVRVWVAPESATSARVVAR